MSQKSYRPSLENTEDDNIHKYNESFQKYLSNIIPAQINQHNMLCTLLCIL